MYESSSSLVMSVRLAQFIQEHANPCHGLVMTLYLAAPSTFFGVVGQLPLKTEAFAKTRRVPGSGDEFSAGQVGAIPHPAYRAAHRRRSRPDSARHVKSSRAARA